MTYSFRNKGAHKILTTFETILDRKGTADDIHRAFQALEDAAPFVRTEVVDQLENKIIRQAQQDAKAWADQRLQDCFAEYDDPNPPAWLSQYEAERLALLDDLERLKPMAQALVQISWRRGDAAHIWTKTFAKQYARLTVRDKNDIEKLAECFANVNYKVGDVKLPPIPAPAPEPEPAPPPPNPAPRQQQKLNKLAEGYKARIVGTPKF